MIRPNGIALVHRIPLTRYRHSRPVAAAAQWVCASCRSYSVRRSKGVDLDRPARTRFAPSPTGFLHLGSLRTALFNYLLARRTGGQFLLRIEDTDQKRTVEGAEEALYDILRWAGLQWDEGPEIGGSYGPYRQSERSHLHQEHAQQLLETGHAYRCFCSIDHLRALAEHRRALGISSEYDRTCASIPPAEAAARAANGESHVIRLRVPDVYPAYTDAVYGNIKPRQTTIRHGEPAFEDPVLIKQDGLPTYHLANVVDDHLMEITHVIRGVEWMASTPRLGGRPPLSATLGYLPDALLNFAALLGWNNRAQSDVLSLEALAQHFNVKDLTKGNTKVNFGKLDYLQKAYVQNYAFSPEPLSSDFLSSVTTAVQTALAVALPDTPDTHRSTDHVRAVLTSDLKNYITPLKFVQQHDYLFLPAPDYDCIEAGVFRRKISGQGVLRAKEDVALLIKVFETRAARGLPLDHEFIDSVLADNWDKDAQKDVQRSLRYALAGGKSGPSVHEIMNLLGAEECVRRLKEVQWYGRRGQLDAKGRVIMTWREPEAPRESDEDEDGMTAADKEAEMGELIRKSQETM
ncbi:hypothetical protein DRE_02321 [Drechslerella stenobrocha 248]|uniref:Uncharacterized protein n=1 Tax=Drechslerella stenobrocha 248 TaxID=1043628 RepID=W7I7Z1_9PEZI|nr:hypothetical protein DRE_02321 [Drechslerella stenobrocha 248]